MSIVLRTENAQPDCLSVKQRHVVRNIFLLNVLSPMSETRSKEEKHVSFFAVARREKTWSSKLNDPSPYFPSETPPISTKPPCRLHPSLNPCHEDSPSFLTHVKKFSQHVAGQICKYLSLRPYFYFNSMY